VKRAIFTHCGSQIVGGDERVPGALVRRLGRERGVEARTADDGRNSASTKLKRPVRQLDPGQSAGAQRRITSGTVR
jgi:hypothetical protein